MQFNENELIENVHPIQTRNIDCGHSRTCVAIKNTNNLPTKMQNSAMFHKTHCTNSYIRGAACEGHLCHLPELFSISWKFLVD